MASIRNGWGFLQAYMALAKARRLLEKRGLKEAQRAMLRPWKSKSRNLLQDDHLASWVEERVLTACRWQVKETLCFPRAAAAYALLRNAGAQPVLYVGMRARPFEAHAWVEVDGSAVADAMSAEDRQRLKVIGCYPLAQQEGADIGAL